jgi:hypothetical protein
MRVKLALFVAFLAGALLAAVLQTKMTARAAGPRESEADAAAAEVPPPPQDIPPGLQKEWESLEFGQTIPTDWGSVISINRVVEGGESYTFWFLATDGTLRGVTTRKFTGPNRGSFFEEVYVIRRK